MANGTTNVGFEDKLWLAADKLRGSMDASEYKHVVLGLIFLKFVSDSFNTKHNELVHEAAGFEEVGMNPEGTGHVLISFEVRDENNMVYMDEIRLNVGENTIIIDESGRPLSLYNLEEGMRVDADISAAMTRSIPPQSFAYRIILIRDNESVAITTDRVVGVDADAGFLLTGNPHDMYDQMIFTISNETAILDKNNNPIRLEDLQAGQLVRVEHAIFQTLSIPPQSPAYRVQII